MGSILQAQEYTRGIDIYPGDPKEYTGPSLVIDAKTYVALMLGERKIIHIELENADIRGERPRVLLKGYNFSNADQP